MTFIVTLLKTPSRHPAASKLMAVLALSVAVSACSKAPFDEPQKLGGQWVSAAKLNRGWETYNNNCMQCHGMDGDGKGPAAQGMVPHPRDFKQGIFKFGNVALGELPTDEDLRRIIRYGLNGTQMLPWDISDERLDAVIQYIKTFSPVWKEQKAGTPVEFTKDPWGPELASQAIEQGRKVYHGLAQCFTCHPAYASVEEVSAYTQEMTGNGVDSLREAAHISMIQGTSFNHSVMPPDFTKHYIRTARTTEDIYKRITLGVNGTTMASWRGMLSLSGDPEEDEKNLWALAYYVKSLSELKWDWRKRMEFFEALDSKRGLVRAKSSSQDSNQP